jgi:hypothetical protein
LENYLYEVRGLWADFRESRDVTDFVTGLKQVNEYWLREFARLGYISTGGITDNVDEAANNAIRFINGYIDNFGKDLAANPDADWLWRALLYPREGHRLAYVLGQQQAMRERGAKAWRRILHPELSQSGPCELCIADSMLVHPIEEPFELLHPGDVCSVQETIGYFAEPPEMVVPGSPATELPVPERPSEQSVMQMLRDSVARLGKGIKHIIRRIRGQ